MSKKKKQLEFTEDELAGIDIKTVDWFPKHLPMEYSKEFVEWINSINRDFRDRTYYEPFELWKKQAEIWMQDTDTLTDYKDYDAQIDFLHREFKRCRDNTLYFSNKYGWIKEGEQVDGWTKYDAWEAQKIVMFLFDCHYSFMIGKPRQVGFTSTVSLCAIKRVNFNKNYFVKFITSKLEKAEEIFRDKIKASFSRLPDWLKQHAANDSSTQLNLAVKETKGTIGGFNSRISVGMPTEDAINGGSPNLVLVDEIGLFEDFGLMLAEGRPALFYVNPETEKLEMRRQVVCWGTGYNMDEGGATFETEFDSAFNEWEGGNYDYGLIPLFFNRWARKGASEEFFESERRAAYAKQGIDREKYIVKYHQSYPQTKEDMFMRSSKTLIPINEINKHILRIGMIPKDFKPRYGYFDPIYDISCPVENLHWPYKVIGARFVETGAMDDDQTTVCIYRPPMPDWENRDYVGTDPINSETGRSKFSSSIWDNVENTIAACLNMRTDNPNDSYSQSLLMKLYYFPGRNWKELIESNIGDGYVDFLERHGYGRCIVANGSLPVILQTPQSKWWGISNKTNTANKIVTELKEMFELYIDNICILWIFLQLKKFIEKDLKGAASNQRLTRYQAADLKYDRDDAIFSGGFSRICGKAFAHHKPYQKNIQVAESQYKTTWVQNKNTNYIRKLAQVDGKGNIVRFMDHTRRRR